MTSFIELPRLAFDGRELPSVYVNVADIVMFVAEYDGQVKIDIRDLGPDGTSIAVKTYIPLTPLLKALADFGDSDNCIFWSDESKEAWAAPVAELLKQAAAREREASRPRP